VNRVSLGAQSFRRSQARSCSAASIARRHRPRGGGPRRAGLDNFNLDLMYALPEQSVDEALDGPGLARWRSAGAHLALPADARAGHAVCETPASATCPMTTELRRCRRPARLTWRSRLRAVRGIGVSRGGSALRAQPRVLALRRLPRHRRRRSRQADATDGSGIVRTVRARHPAAYLAATTRQTG
jgi:hypothetical protein